QREFMQIAVEPAARLERLELVVRVVVDDVLATTYAALADRALPPGEDGLPAIRLRAEVGRLESVRHLVVPDDAPLVVRDHGPARLVLASLHGNEDEAGRNAGRGVRDGQVRRRDAIERAER